MASFQDPKHPRSDSQVLMADIKTLNTDTIYIKPETIRAEHLAEAKQTENDAIGVNRDKALEMFNRLIKAAKDFVVEEAAGKRGYNEELAGINGLREAAKMELTARDKEAKEQKEKVLLKKRA